MGKCSFINNWLLKEDCNGKKISEWCSQHSDSEAFCKLCTVPINISKKGFQALAQHASTAKHKQFCLIKLEPNQLRLTSISKAFSSQEQQTSSNNCATSQTVRLYSVKDNATIAELIWILKCVESNYSAASSDGIINVFRAMFPEAELPQSFSLSRHKIHYVLNEALCPYFKNELIEEMGNNFFTLCFDETTNSGSHKELQTSIRFWSVLQNRIVNHHLQTFFMGIAKGENLFKKIKSAIDSSNISMNRLLMIGSDGPNVNKTVKRLLNEEVKLIRKQGLVEIGFCNIHVLHNAFKKGLAELGSDASDLVIALHSFFDGWPSRWENFTQIQDEIGAPKHHFIKHCPSRWLTLENAASRVIEQWDAIQKYFFTFIPIKDSKQMSSNNYKLISKLFKIGTMKAELEFVCSSAKVFTKFTGLFQKDEPLIHLLYTTAETIASTLAGRVCKSEVKIEFDNDDLFAAKNLLPVQKVVVSEKVERALMEAKSGKQFFLKQVQQHYIQAYKYMIKKGPISSKLTKHFRCLNPALKNVPESEDDIVVIAKSLPLENLNVEILIDEWKLHKLDKISYDPKVDGGIDFYWRNYLMMKDCEGNLKYPTLSEVIKCALSLSHGNATIERGFSLSGKILTEERTRMTESTLNSYLVVKDALRRYDNKPELVPITRNLVRMAQNAYRQYAIHLEKLKSEEAERKKKAEEENEQKKMDAEVVKEIEHKKKSVETKEKELKKKQKDEDAKEETAKHVFKEASERLQKALEKKDFNEIAIANAMLSGYSKMQREGEERKKEIKNLQLDIEKRKATIEKRKTTLITKFVCKKPKL